MSGDDRRAGGGGSVDLRVALERARKVARQAEAEAEAEAEAAIGLQAGREIERGVFDIETVKAANQALIETIEKSLRIADEGQCAVGWGLGRGGADAWGSIGPRMNANGRE